MTFDFERDCHPYTAEELIAAFEEVTSSWWRTGIRWTAKRYAGFILYYLRRHYCRPARPRGVSERMVIRADKYIQVAEKLEKARRVKAAEEAAADKAAREEAKP